MVTVDGVRLNLYQGWLITSKTLTLGWLKAAFFLAFVSVKQMLNWSTKMFQKNKTEKDGKTIGDYGKWVIIEPYGVPVVVITNAEEYQELHIGITGEPCDKVAISEGLTLDLHQPEWGHLYLMYLPKRYDEETTWHESLHMTHIIMEAMGITVKGFENDDSSSSETQAYMQGHMVKRIKEEVYPKKKRAPRKAPSDSTDKKNSSSC